ncbi:hypothetical protein PSE_1158 [Pseudovibrio sp. FO-BEG1]|uniref:hypothetical protein n=1 Tax=Pseudovibrio sp. (strain FO-BEG1) TaxID=911045 RepID=UPI000238CCC3|nr:hypothetical protein [Pseudovibrio sp. FO-BEG1]AEV35670.1 hypothetical protein PSE_1158 [Pseudovibrio sp. FO-BEG1]
MSDAEILAPALLAKILGSLRKTVVFVVLRNYENLPSSWGNDIDILVAPEDLTRAHAVVVEEMKASVSSGIKIEIMQRFNFRATRVACHDRELHIDLYSAMSKAWLTYASTTVILRERKKNHGLFDTPDPLHEQLLIAAKELFSYGQIRSRYHSGLTGHDFNEANCVAQELFGDRITKDGRELIARALVDPSVEGRPQPSANSWFQPIQALQWVRQRHQGWVPA